MATVLKITDDSILKGISIGDIMTVRQSRSEERRVGKECSS